MPHIEPRSCNGCDKKLASIGVWTSVSHGEKTWLVKLDLWFELVFKRSAPDRFAAGSGSRRIAALNHKIANDSMKRNPVVIMFVHQPQEIFTCFRSDLVHQSNLDDPLIRLEHHYGFILAHCLHLLSKYWIQPGYENKCKNC